MENIIEKVPTSKLETCLPALFALPKQSGTFSMVWKNIRKWLLSVRDFVECPSFYEGENTDTSRFEVKIEFIKRLNNM